jgi:hypothetical protein
VLDVFGKFSVEVEQNVPRGLLSGIFKKNYTSLLLGAKMGLIGPNKVFGLSIRNLFSE